MTDEIKNEAALESRRRPAQPKAPEDRKTPRKARPDHPEGAPGRFGDVREVAPDGQR